MTPEPPRFDTDWVQYATEQFTSLPPEVRQAVMARVAELERDPARYSTYHS